MRNGVNFNNKVTLRTLQTVAFLRSEERFFDPKELSPLEWCACLAGEVGELANRVKKLHIEEGQLMVRPDKPSEAFKDRAAMKDEISKEIGDVAVYLTLVATSLDLDFADAVVDKFNEVSERVNSSMRL